MNSSRITESQNLPRWKGPTRIIESNSLLHTGPPKNQTMCLKVLPKHFLNSGRLGAVTTSLGSLSQCQRNIEREEKIPK